MNANVSRLATLAVLSYRYGRVSITTGLQIHILQPQVVCWFKKILDVCG